MSLEGVLSIAEADRVVVIGQVAEKCLRQREAARRLGVSVRQVKRLLARYRERGPAGLVSGHRGKVSNNAMAAVVRRAAMDLVRERYADFGPTFACEKLVEVHGYRLSVETLRKWMVAEGVWRAKARRAARVHQSRPRRECVGDLVQIDGSPHVWFEGRGPVCTLIVYIDDATSRLLALGFFAAETTEAYMETTRAHLAAHGRPVAYLAEFMAEFNRRFAVAPRNPADAHRAVLHDPRELDLILCEQHVRKLTKNLTVGFECREHQVTGRGMGYRLRGAAVTVCKAFDGSVTVLRDSRELPVRLLAQGAEAAPVEDEKSVRPRVDRAKAEQQSRPTWKPAPDHPWRQPFKPETTGVAAG